MKVDIIPLNKFVDERGSLLKVLMRHQLDGQTEFGEIYVCVSRPGEVRAHHYHTQTTEWFCVTSGKALLTLENLDTGEKRGIDMDGDTPCAVVIPPRVAHAIENTGEQDMTLLAYADQPYDPDNPDTTPYQIQ